MIQHFGFRRVLPLGQLAVFIILVSIGAFQVSQPVPRPHANKVARQENALPDWHPKTQYKMPAAWLIAIALNVPATMIGALCAEIFHVGSNLGGLLCSMPFVPLLWYFVGHWLDHQCNILPLCHPGRGIRIACWVGIALSAMLLAVGIMAIRSHNSLTAEVASLATGWIAWSGLLLTMCILTLRRRNAQDTKIVHA